jgi:GT2 family glycosyltransferase
MTETPVMNARIAIVVLTVDQRERTLRLLRSLVHDDARARILVWDNGSTDGTDDAVRREFPAVHVHRHPTNLGVASGRNSGAALAIERYQPTHLLFLDNDMVVQHGFVNALLEPFAREPRLGQTQAKLLYMDEPTRINDGGGCRINFWLGRTHPVGCGQIDRGQCDEMAPCISCGGAMLVRTEVFQELGGFDATFDPFGPEDIDFSLRLQKRGYRALYVPGAVAYHEVSHTFEGGGYTTRYARSKARHWLRFLGRHGTLAQKVGFAVIGVPMIALRLTVREALRGNPGAIVGSVRGLFEALRDSARPSR